MLIHRLLYIGRWRVDFFFAQGDFDPSSVLECLEDMDAPNRVLEDSWFKMQRGVVNEGFSWPNSRMMRSCIYIGPTTDGAEFVNTLTHELRHLADDIATFLGIDLRGEEVAYITGNTAQEFVEVICRLGCPCCHD